MKPLGFLLHRTQASTTMTSPDRSLTMIQAASAIPVSSSAVPRPAIDLLAPARVETATFALG